MVSLELEARLDNLLSTGQRKTANIDLFTPIQEREECPICMIPLPIEEDKIHFMVCCGKSICDGCIYKQIETDVEKGLQKPSDFKCTFCRQPKPKNNIKALKKLMKKNNTEALVQMAIKYEEGNEVFQSNTKALEMSIKAAELGLAQAYALIAQYYDDGIVVEQNQSKVLEFLNVSAKKGSIPAHRWLAEIHNKNGNVKEGIKHYKLTASAGDRDFVSYYYYYYFASL